MVHGVTFYYSGKPKPWLSPVTPSSILEPPEETPQATSRINNVQRSSTYDGNIIYAYDTGSGVYVYQAATPRVQRTGIILNGVEGSYSYTSPDGTKVTVTYTANENGYNPKVSIARH